MTLVRHACARSGGRRSIGAVLSSVDSRLAATPRRRSAYKLWKVTVVDTVSGVTSSTMLTPTERNLRCLERAAAAIRQGYVARYDSERRAFMVPSRSTAGREYAVRVMAHGGEVCFSCPCVAAGGHVTVAVTPCTHAATAACTAGTYELVEFDGRLWRLTPKGRSVVEHAGRLAAA